MERKDDAALEDDVLGIGRMWLRSGAAQLSCICFSLEKLHVAMKLDSPLLMPVLLEERCILLSDIDIDLVKSRSFQINDVADVD